jgi:hypothetical protein
MILLLFMFMLLFLFFFVPLRLHWHSTGQVRRGRPIADPKPSFIAPSLMGLSPDRPAICEGGRLSRPFVILRHLFFQSSTKWHKPETFLFALIS